MPLDITSGQITAVTTPYQPDAALYIGIALILAALVLAIDRLVIRRRRLSAKTLLNTRISITPGGVPPSVRRKAEALENLSMAAVRVKNSGMVAIMEKDWIAPLSFTFEDARQIVDFEVTELQGTALPNWHADGRKITMDPQTMKPGSRFKLAVVLEGTSGKAGHGGAIRSWTGTGIIDDTKTRKVTYTQAMVASCFGLVIALAATLITPLATNSQVKTVLTGCVTGSLSVIGSSAFAPAAQQIGQSYTSACRGAAISVSAIGSFYGLNAVNGVGSGVHSSAIPQIAMSDGPAPSGYPALVGHPVAVVIFAVVVNRQAGVFNLTVPELRGIFLGTITNWHQLGGANLPVRIVARTAGSGTRRAFDNKVLDHAEPAFSSYNCFGKDPAIDSPVIRCEAADTGTLLQRINEIPGAIGYAQISDAAAYPNVLSVKLNGWDPAIGAVERGNYPFWAVEYLYTYGSPAPGTLAAAFLAYTTSDTAKDILRSQAYIPCIDRHQISISTLCRG
jgi:ABC-type phosphate transport system substrate-binding protein